MGHKCYAVQCVASGEETPKIVPSPWDFVILPGKERDTVMGNMHKKLGRDRARGSGDILADRQRHTQT